MNKDSYTPCTKCGRPMRYCKGECCGKKPEGCDCREYGCKHNACIREKNPECPYEAVIPSVTVETINNLKDLADCFVHVSDINTTFYIDDKHRIMTTWAGLVSVDDYDFEANPLNLRGQIAYDSKNNKAAIYDKQGANYIFQISDIDNDYLLLENKPSINGVELAGNKTLADLSIAATFDTVADMKEATNLVVGSFAQTLGFHTINDGGSALYKIADTGTADERGTIAVGDLYATIVTKDHVTPEMYGAYGDGTHDDTASLQACVASMLPVEMTKTYLISSTLVLDESTSATLYSLPVEKYYNATIKGNVLPLLETQRGACSIDGITFENTGSYSTLSPIVYLNNRSSEDVDTIVKRCNFRHNSLGIFIKGRNAVVEDNIFYDFNNTGSCIKLNYVQYNTAAENSSNINDFNRYKDGNRGFRIHHNRTHYTRNFLVDTTEASCEYIHGMEITDNYLEAGSLIKGYVENAQISNNITFQLYKDNYIIDATNMNNVNISNNHWAGNNAFTTEAGVSVGEASYQGAIISRGACKNCNITDNFVTNTRTGYVTILGSFTGRITGTVVLTPAFTGSNIIACTGASGTVHAYVNVTLTADSKPANLKTVLSLSYDQMGINGKFTTNMADVSFCDKYIGLDLCKQVSYAGSGTAKSIFMEYPYNIVEIWDYSGGTWSMRTLSSSAISLANYTITLDSANASSHSYILKMFYSKSA